MASSRRSRPADRDPGSAAVARIRDAVASALRGLHGTRVAVALSGGRDSIALFDAVCAYAAQAPLVVTALHVHHGLSPNADRWAALCESVASAHSVEIITLRIDVPRAARASVEAEARRARYRALAQTAEARDIDVVLLAHHADDQAETVLLQLARGSGPHGLAAMSAERAFAGVRWVRPLLDVTRSDIDAYVRTRRLDFADDESNADRRFRRNALRRDVIPVLRAHLHGYPQALARSAAHQSESAELQDDLARIDAGAAYDGVSLECVALAGLSPPRARNLLRWFLREQGLVAPSTARLRAMLDQLVAPRRDAQIELRHDERIVGVFRDRIFVHAVAPSFRHIWRGESRVTLPHGVLHFEPAHGEGLAARPLANAETVVQPRRGGERIQLAANRPRRALSAWFNETGIAGWERSSLPLVFCDGALAAVPGLGIDIAFAAGPEHDAWRVVWEPQPDFRPRAR